MLKNYSIGIYSSYATSDSDIGGDTLLNIPECTTEAKVLTEPILITLWHTGAGNYDMVFTFSDLSSHEFSNLYLLQAAVPPNTTVNLTSVLRKVLAKIGGQITQFNSIIATCKNMGVSEDFHYCMYGRKVGGLYGYKLGA